jgi:hypothetical protein
MQLYVVHGSEAAEAEGRISEPTYKIVQVFLAHMRFFVTINGALLSMQRR